MFKQKAFRLGVIPVAALILAFGIFAADQSSLGLVASQPEKNFYIRVAGVDTSASLTGWTRLTITGSNPQQSATQTGEQSAAKIPYIISQDGESVFDANRRMRTTSELDPFWGHIAFLLLGEAAAKEDVSKYLDFFVRDHESRFSIDVMVAKGQSAEDVIKKGHLSSFLLGERLENIADASKNYSVSGKVNLLQLTHMLSGDSDAAYVPCVEFDPAVYYAGEIDKGKLGISFSGYAVFKHNKLVGYIEDGLARGFNFIINQVRSTSFIVNSKEGAKVTMELISNHTTVEPEMENGKPVINITVEMETNISDIQENANVFTEEEIAILKAGQDRLVRDEIMGVINKMKGQGTDIFDFAGAFKRKYPDEWKGMKNGWESAFRSLDVEVEVDSAIRRTYNIVEPATQKG